MASSIYFPSSPLTESTPFASSQNHPVLSSKTTLNSGRVASTAESALQRKTDSFASTIQQAEFDG